MSGGLCAGSQFGHEDLLDSWCKDPCGSGVLGGVMVIEGAGSRSAAPAAGFEELYRAHWDPMVRLATLLVDRPAVAEELVQEASVRVERAYDQLDAALAYLRAAVVNRCRNHLRRVSLERRHRPEPPLEVTGPELDETWQPSTSISARPARVQDR